MQPVDIDLTAKVADVNDLCPDCLSSGVRRTIGSHKHETVYTQSVRTGLVCPLCGEKYHGREASAWQQALGCLFAQWSKATQPGKVLLPVTPDNVAAMGAWLVANPTIEYGRGGQYKAWSAIAAAGQLQLSSASQADYDKWTARGQKVTTPTANATSGLVIPPAPPTDSESAPDAATIPPPSVEVEPAAPIPPTIAPDAAEPVALADSKPTAPISLYELSKTAEPEPESKPKKPRKPLTEEQLARIKEMQRRMADS